jgi:hypothetical protein
MFAMVEADMSTSLSAPRCSRSGDSGALVSENGTDPLINPPPVCRLAAVLQWIVRRGTAQGKRHPRGNENVLGYHGYAEVEIFNQEVWGTPAEQVAARVKARFAGLLG